MKVLQMVLRGFALLLILSSCSDSSGPGGELDISGNWSATISYGLLRVTIQPYDDPGDLEGSCTLGADVDCDIRGSITSGQVALQMEGDEGTVHFTGNAAGSTLVGVLNGWWMQGGGWLYEFEESSVTFSR